MAGYFSAGDIAALEKGRKEVQRQFAECASATSYGRIEPGAAMNTRLKDCVGASIRWCARSTSSSISFRRSGKIFPIRTKSWRSRLLSSPSCSMRLAVSIISRGFGYTRGGSPAGSRFPAPIGSEPCAVPTDHGIRLDDRQRAPNIGEQPIEADQYQSVDAAEQKPLWRGPPQDIDLLAQHQDLRLKLCSRSE